MKWHLIALYRHLKWGRFLLVVFFRNLWNTRGTFFFSPSKRLRKVPLFNSHNYWQVIWGTFSFSVQLKYLRSSWGLHFWGYEYKLQFFLLYWSACSIGAPCVYLKPQTRENSCQKMIFYWRLNYCFQ